MSQNSRRSKMLELYKNRETEKTETGETPVDELLEDKVTLPEKTEPVKKEPKPTEVSTEEVKDLKTQKKPTTSEKVSLKSTKIDMPSSAVSSMQNGQKNKDIETQGINLRYSQENDDFIKIGAMKNNITLTAFIENVMFSLKDDLEQEEISDEEFISNARIVRTYNTSFQNHYFYLNKDIVEFIKKESNRRGMKVPAFLNYAFERYKSKK